MGQIQSNTALDSINTNAPSCNVPAIYRIKNIQNGNYYIGSSKRVRERWQVHYWLLEDGSNHCRYLQNAWNKYGRDKFVFEILELVENVACLIEREQYFIDTLRPRYNAALKASGGSAPWTEKSKAKLRKPKSRQTIERMRAGAKRSYELNPALRQLRIDTFRKHRETHPEYNRGPNNGSYGKRINQDVLHTPEVQAKRTAGLRRAHAEGRAVVRLRPVEQLDSDSNVLMRFPSVKSAAIAIGITPGRLSNACRGRWEFVNGYKWRYAGERTAQRLDSNSNLPTNGQGNGMLAVDS